MSSLRRIAQSRFTWMESGTIANPSSSINVLINNVHKMGFLPTFSSSYLENGVFTLNRSVPKVQYPPPPCLLTELPDRAHAAAGDHRLVGDVRKADHSNCIVILR